VRVGLTKPAGKMFAALAMPLCSRPHQTLASRSMTRVAAEGAVTDDAVFAMVEVQHCVEIDAVGAVRRPAQPQAVAALWRPVGP
jgi:hypothetical protein